MNFPYCSDTLSTFIVVGVLVPVALEALKTFAKPNEKSLDLNEIPAFSTIMSYCQQPVTFIKIKADAASRRNTISNTVSTASK